MPKQIYGKHFGRAGAVAAVAATLGLGACGGGGGSEDVASPDLSSVQVAGLVLDGPIRGTRVFLDLNGDLAHDPGEPISAPSAADGAFSLVTGRLTQAQLATANFVSHVPDQAADADDGGQDLLEAGRRGFTLMTPASAYLQTSENRSTAAPLLTPFTTLVAAEMAFNGLSLAQAKAAVQARVGLGGKDPMSNFVEQADRGLGAKARVTPRGAR